MYGNAFAVFALASLYGLTHDNEILELATKSFEWIESRAFDADDGGYFQFLTREGEPFDEASQYRSVASDAREVGLKDQNSSIHLLEAYTELLRNWPDERLKSKLASLLRLIRDTMVTKKGYLQLFFNRDWTPVTFRLASEATRALNYDLDQVSFGHDYETAFLMLEASHVLGLKGDAQTLVTARQMLDHALEHGWDTEFGGFFDAGYYHEGHEDCAIIRKTKTWWSQAEALNALLLFSHIFPEDPRYREYFEKEWEYVDKYLLDHKYGDWYEGGLDREPQAATGPKSQMWKCTYHTGRALTNCIALTSAKNRLSSGFTKRRCELDALIDHWRTQKAQIEKSGTVTADAHTA
jgi:mannobiose 2-epimerase